ncbi:MAG: putative F420-dependent oxidoreductase [Gammaproteobacteria bacterium]|jgi:probable F420-dependent oxidoreductase
MKILTTLPQGNLNDVPAAVARAEAAGFDAVCTMENRNDPFLSLAVAAVSSKHIGLATGVAIAFPRSPMLVANTSWDLQSASGGRFVLGLGPQIRPHNEKRFSTPWSAPVPRMREYVQALRAIWRSWQLGERLRFEGEHYTFTLMTPNFVPASTNQPSVPITIAAVGPHSLRLAGEACDGVRLHPFCTRSYLEHVCMPRITEGMKKTGRKREEFEVTGGGFVATGKDDEEVAAAVEWVRYRIAFYGSTPSYWPVFEHHGHGDLGRKLNRLTKEGKWDTIANEISDDLVREFAAIGRYNELAQAVKTRFGGVSDSVFASTSQDIQPEIPAEVIAEIQAVPTVFKGFRSQW